MMGEVILTDTFESSNTWTYALVHADCLRTTRNPLNRHPGEGILLHGQNGAFGSRHPGGATFCLADGHVKTLSDQISHNIYREYSTTRGTTTSVDAAH